MTKLNVGMIGCGAIALGAHLPALRRNGERARLRSICDVRADVAATTADSLEVDRWTTNFHEILDDTEIDAVIITTPEFLHAEQTIAALNAGKHVLCEKPMAATLPEADAMIDAEVRTGRRLMIAHSRRFTARYQHIRAIVDSGELGELILIRENERRPRAHYSAMKLPVGHWQPNEGRPGSWKDSAAFSGGVARGHAIHEVDLFRWFAGSEAKRVWAESLITIAGREVPDALSFQVEFANGMIGACDLFTNAPSTYPWYHQFELIGTRGCVYARDSDMNVLTTFDSNGGHFPVSFETLLHVDDAYVNEQRAFFDAIAHDAPLALDTKSARAALELALAITTSAETGMPVDLPLASIYPRTNAG